MGEESGHEDLRLCRCVMNEGVSHTFKGSIVFSSNKVQSSSESPQLRLSLPKPGIEDKAQVLFMIPAGPSVDVRVRHTQG